MVPFFQHACHRGQFPGALGDFTIKGHSQSIRDFCVFGGEQSGSGEEDRGESRVLGEDQRRERENGEEHEPECAAREENKTGERNLSGRRTRLHRSSILEDGKREECTGSFAVIYLTVRVKATAIILSSDLFFLFLLPSALMHSPPCAFRLR